MKRVVATAVCDLEKNQIYNFSVNHSGRFITLINYTGEKIKPYVYNNFNDLYRAILTILKNNNMYVTSDKSAGAIWYDIQFIDINNPGAGIKKYSLPA
jgi:hypothetical protein